MINQWKLPNAICPFPSLRFPKRIHDLINPFRTRNMCNGSSSFVFLHHPLLWQETREGRRKSPVSRSFYPGVISGGRPENSLSCYIFGGRKFAKIWSPKNVFGGIFMKLRLIGVTKNTVCRRVKEKYSASPCYFPQKSKLVEADASESVSRHFAGQTASERKCNRKMSRAARRSCINFSDYFWGSRCSVFFGAGLEHICPFPRKRKG